MDKNGPASRTRSKTRKKTLFQQIWSNNDDCTTLK